MPTSVRRELAITPTSLRGVLTVAALALGLIGSPGGLLGDDDPARAQYLELRERGAQLFHQGEYKKATEAFEQALSLAIKVFGPDHPDVALSIYQLAGLYDAQGRYAEAEPHYLRSLKILEEKLGPDHPNVALVRVSHFFPGLHKHIVSRPPCVSGVS
jgi:tetratricopeptide (TPR) repeat protein